MIGAGAGNGCPPGQPKVGASFQAKALLRQVLGGRASYRLCATSELHKPRKTISLLLMHEVPLPLRAAAPILLPLTDSDQGRQPGDDRAVPTDLLNGSVAMPMVILHSCTFFRGLLLVERQAGHERGDALGIRSRQNLRKHEPNAEARP